MKIWSIAPLDAVGDPGHHAGKQVHSGFHGSGKLRRPERLRHGAMRRFLLLHSGDHRARTGISLRQSLEVTAKMLLDLALGFREESEAPAVAEQAGSRAERE